MKRPDGKRILRRILTITVSIVVLLVLAVGGGVAYTYVMGKNAPVAAPVATDTVSTATRQAAMNDDRPKPDPDDPVGVSIQALTSPVIPGENASVAIRTTPTADCTVTVEYDKKKSTDSGLAPKQADDYGTLSWSWTVEQGVPYGTWPVDITCKYGKKSAQVRGELKVARTIDG